MFLERLITASPKLHQVCWETKHLELIIIIILKQNQFGMAKQSSYMENEGIPCILKDPLSQRQLKSNLSLNIYM